MRIVVTHEKKLYVLDEPIPEAPPAGAFAARRNAQTRHVNDSVEVSCIMLATMTPELQKQHEGMTAFDMIGHLKTLYEEHARHERFDAPRPFSQPSCQKDVP